MSPGRSFLGVPSDVQQDLAHLLPEFQQSIDICATSLEAFVQRFVGSGGVGDAQMSIVTQAVNDFLDLLFDISCGRGRPALRTARSLLEHVTNLRDVGNGQSEADRYLGHLVVAQYWQSLLTLPEESLSGGDRKSMEHHRKKLARDAKKPMDRLTSEYGSAFKRQWSGASFRDRVTRQDLKQYWPFYALSSAVLHGAAGGVLGLVDFSTYGRPVHRTGPALELCPLAFLYGLEFFTLLMKECNLILSESADGALKTLRHLRGTWKDYRRAINQIDSEMWPDAPPTPYATVLQVLPSGKRRWWLWDSARNRVARAEPPNEDVTDEQMRSIESVAAGLDALGDPVTLVLQGIRVSPSDPLQWQHAGRLLVQKPLGGWDNLGPINPTNPRRFSPGSDPTK